MCFILQLSFIDLSPDHAGTLYSVANSLSCVCLIASPYFTGIMIQEEVSHKVTNLLHYPYRVTILVNEYLQLTEIWNVPPSCKGITH